MQASAPPRTTVLIASYLEAEHVDAIRQVQGIRVVYEPDLLPRPRHRSDHIGHPLHRTEPQESRWREYLAEAEVMFGFDYPNAAEFKSLIPRVRWIQATSSGVGQFLLQTGLIETGITITTARGIHAKPLADFVLMAILWFAKDGFRMLEHQAARRWERYCGRDLRGTTVGIVGLGAIGRETARVCRAVGMRVFATKRVVSLGTTEPDVDRLVPLADLPVLLAEADYLVLATPQTPQTAGLIGRRELALMKQDAVFINVARGGLVDEPALIEALQRGDLRGAAMDVFAKEPPDADNPLWALPNVLMSPHSTATVETENARLTDLFCENLRRYLGGQVLLNLFGRERLY